MEISYDPAKNEWNIAERGLPFDRAADFHFDGAVYAVDDRRDYGETRIQAFGYLGDRLHVLVFVARESGIRVISFRRANDREVKRYGQKARPRND